MLVDVVAVEKLQQKGLALFLRATLLDAANLPTEKNPAEYRSHIAEDAVHQNDIPILFGIKRIHKWNENCAAAKAVQRQKAAFAGDDAAHNGAKQRKSAPFVNDDAHGVRRTRLHGAACGGEHRKKAEQDGGGFAGGL